MNRVAEAGGGTEARRALRRALPLSRYPPVSRSLIQAHALNEALRAIGIRHRALAGALLAPLGLHPGQEVLLLELAEQGPRSQAQLAHTSGCEPPTITNSVRKLEAAGLVVRHPSPTDGRVTIVELSDRGQQLLPRLTTAWQQLAERTVAQLDDEPLDPLVHTLTELARSLKATSAPATESAPLPRDVA